MSDASPKTNATHTVQEKDSTDYLSYATGHFWQTIWDHPDNSDLAGSRSHQNELEPGDTVFIPELRQKSETRQADLVHTFKRKGVPFEIVYVVRTVLGETLSDSDYVLQIGNSRYEGKTDGQGKLHAYVQPKARTGKLTVKVEKPGYPTHVDFQIEIGPTPPPNSVRGMKFRLAALGYAPGEINGDVDDASTSAAEFFLSDRTSDCAADFSAALAEEIDAAYQSMVTGTAT